MNIFKSIKLRRLLKRRYKLKAELMTLEDVKFNMYDTVVYRGGISGERWIRISNLKKQIHNINEQIDELTAKG